MGYGICKRLRGAAMRVLLFSPLLISSSQFSLSPLQLTHRLVFLCSPSFYNPPSFFLWFALCTMCCVLYVVVYYLHAAAIYLLISIVAHSKINITSPYD